MASIDSIRAVVLAVLAPESVVLSPFQFCETLIARMCVLGALALVLHWLLRRLPWLPLPVTLVAIVHWHQSARALVSCLLGNTSCSAVVEAGGLRLVDSLGSALLRLAHMLTVVHEFTLPYWALYIFGALSVGGVSFWYLHLLFLGLDVQAKVETKPRRVLWASDLLALLELAVLLVSCALVAPIVMAADWAALLRALPLSGLSTLSLLAPAARAVHHEELLAALSVLAWYVPRVSVPDSPVRSWILRGLLVAACSLNVTLALSLAIAALRTWPLKAHNVPTQGGVYGLLR